MSYQYLRQSYSAGPHYLTTTTPDGSYVLKKETSEEDSDYKGRKGRCPVRNHIGLIIDRYHSAAVKSPVSRDENWKELWNDYEFAFHDALKEAQIVGAAYLVFTLNEARNRSEIDMPVFIVPADSVIDWSHGTIFAFTDIDDKGNEIKTVYTSDGIWRKMRGDEIIEVGDSGFSLLPVVEIKPDFPSVSQVGLLAPIQESLVNLLSLHMEESLQSTFTRHIIGGLSEYPKTQKDKHAAEKMIAGKRLLLFKDQVSLSNMSADASQAQNLLAAITQTENMLYAVAGLRLSEPVRESGLAKQIEMEQFNDVRGKLIRALEKAEEAFMILIESTFEIQYERSDYSYETVVPTWTERITELKDLLSLGLSEEFYEKVRAQFESDYLPDDN